MKLTKKSIGLLAGLCFTLFVSITVNAATYRVTPGDSLYEIAKVFNTSTSTIMKDNNLSGSMIYPGQALYVPGKEHTVIKGDTLYLIGKKYNVSVSTLRRANNEWDDYLFIGQRLSIPTPAQSSTLNNFTTVQMPSTAPQSTGTAKVSYSSSELDLLARLITAEAQSEPYDAQVAVGGVIVNRILDSRFPSTISSVIYEKSYGYYQFTPVENGWINKPATSTARKAALEAINGRDPSNGSVFYFDDSTTNKWLWSKPIRARIGKMVYVY